MLDLSYRGPDLPLASLIDEIRAQSIPGQPTIVGVDGRAGAGKTTLCEALASLYPAIAIVHTDGFYVPLAERTAPEDEVGPQIDWRRLLADVVDPLLAGRPARYQTFDWDAHRLLDWHDVAPDRLVLLDGVYSTREEIAPFLTYRIWVDVPREIGLERGVGRDGNEKWWLDDWVEDEDRYVLMERPEEQADAVVDGTVDPALYAAGKYRRLR